MLSVFDERVGRSAWEAYGKSRWGRNVPTQIREWGNLEERVKEAWAEAGLAAAEEFIEMVKVRADQEMEIGKLAGE